MKAFIQGTVLGAIIMAAVAGGYAYGTSRNNQLETRPGKRVLTQEEVAGRCDVRVGYGSITGGDSCFSGEVMVGSRAGYILCSDITVTCDR